VSGANIGLFQKSSNIKA